MATIKFFLQSKKNPATIFLSLSIRAKSVFKRKTNYVINPSNWSDATNLPKPNDEELKSLKTNLGKLKNKIEENLNSATSNGIEISGDWLHEQINTITGKVKTTENDRLINCCNVYIEFLPHKKQRNGKRGVTQSTITRYNAVKNKIDEFEEYRKKKILVKDVGLKFIEEFETYLSDVDKLGVNSINRCIKFVKTVCLWATTAKNIPAHKELNKIKGYGEKASIIFLTFEELETIENKIFERSALENAKDWLIIGCYIGQRVSDLLILTRDNLTVRNGLELLELTQKKTGKKVVIPLHSKVKEILEKRNGAFPEKISDQKFNRHIKDLCKLAEINQLIEGGKMTKQKEINKFRKEFGKFPKHELISSHVCRRSFASNFYGDIPTPLLISITAHATEQQFLEYIGKTSNDYAIQLAEYWSKQQLEAKKEPRMTVLNKAN